MLPRPRGLTSPISRLQRRWRTRATCWPTAGSSYSPMPRGLSSSPRWTGPSHTSLGWRSCSPRGPFSTPRVSGYSAPRRISDADDVTSFSSGEPSLDDYLRKRALANHVQGGSRCFVTCRDGRVVGFYALASGSVAHADAPGRVRRNMPDPVPVILLSRLAVDRKEQGRGLGSHLLRDAIGRCVQAADSIGLRAILVHALHDEARAFYVHFDFEISPTDPLHLMLLMKDARALIGD